MKSIDKIIDELTMEVDESYQETINKLRQQNGKCAVTDSNQRNLMFYCTKKGKMGIIETDYFGHRRFYIDHLWLSELRSRTYYVTGKVLTENGKTVVKIYSFYSRAFLSNRIFGILLNVVFIVFLFAILFLSGNPITVKDILIIIALGLIFSVFDFAIFKELKNKETDLEIMKNEIIKRVNAIKRWDD
ncbi:MAG TPA: hypothetical protein H9675_07590 [Firmicutes bacterium]|nr:hypothetical protein [Bacillota bacterium]